MWLNLRLVYPMGFVDQFQVNSNCKLSFHFMWNPIWLNLQLSKYDHVNGEIITSIYLYNRVSTKRFCTCSIPFQKCGRGRRAGVLQLSEVMLSSKYLTWAANNMRQVTWHAKCNEPAVPSTSVWVSIFVHVLGFFLLDITATEILQLCGKASMSSWYLSTLMDSFLTWKPNITFPSVKWEQ